MAGAWPRPQTRLAGWVLTQDLHGPWTRGQWVPLCREGQGWGLGSPCPSGSGGRALSSPGQAGRRGVVAWTGRGLGGGGNGGCCLGCTEYEPWFRESGTTSCPSHHCHRLATLGCPRAVGTPRPATRPHRQPGSCGLHPQGHQAGPTTGRPRDLARNLAAPWTEACAAHFIPRGPRTTRD